MAKATGEAEFNSHYTFWEVREDVKYWDLRKMLGITII